MAKKKNEIQDVDNLPELGAYGIKKLFQALNSWKKTIRLILVLLSCMGAAVAVKYFLGVLK